MVFTFWEGTMPDYIRLCMSTWDFPYVVLNYDNLSEYTDFKILSTLKQFILPRVANCVRAHVLRDQGGYWLDTDTIMITNELPETNVIGDVASRTTSIGYLYAEKPHMEFFEKWSEFQDKILADPDVEETCWSFLSNDFTDPYVATHPEITISNIENCWPETYMISGNQHRQFKYEEFYFEKHYHLGDIRPTNMLMLHNSWTPDWYKELLTDELLNKNCTLSNILKEVIIG